MEEVKKAKNGGIIVDFSKIEARLKALYVRYKGIPEGGSESLINKGFQGAAKAKELIFIYEWWRLVDEFRNFCLNDNTNILHNLKTIITTI